MFEVGFQELLLISVVALVVLGPERLPKVLRQVGRWVGKARSMARQFREQLESEVDLDELTRSNTAPRRPNAYSATGTVVGGAEPPVPVDASASDALSTAHLAPENEPHHPAVDPAEAGAGETAATAAPESASGPQPAHHPENDVYGAAPVNEPPAASEPEYEASESRSAVHDRSA